MSTKSVCVCMCNNRAYLPTCTYDNPFNLSNNAAKAPASCHSVIGPKNVDVVPKGCAAAKLVVPQTHRILLFVKVRQFIYRTLVLTNVDALMPNFTPPLYLPTYLLSCI